MNNEVRGLVDEYLKWLKEKTVVKQTGEWTEVTTPFVDRHNDLLQIYVRQQGDDFLMTDDGYIIADLNNSGCSLSTPKRKALLQTVLNGFGVDFDGKSITVIARKNNFFLKKHNLLQAMLAINDLFSLAESNVVSLFFEDVEKWLDENHIRYTPSVKITGKSRYDHYFDFVIPRSKEYPERVLQVVTNPSRATVESFAWAWVDTREVRRPGTRAFAVLNDKKPISPAVLDALKSYEVIPVLWGNRSELLPEIVN